MLLPPGVLRAGSPEAAAVAAAWIGSYDQAIATSRDASDAVVVGWLEAYVAAATGSFSQAATLAEPLAKGARSAHIAVACALTAGAAYRQSQKYEAARRMDLLAWERAVHPSERANALVSLAADSIGDGDADLCARLLTQAEQVRHAGIRTAIRRAWVGCELDLLRSDAATAASGARTALSHATASGARRHIAKSTLFLGVALEAAGDPAAARVLADAERLSARIGARALRAVAAAQLARMR